MHEDHIYENNEDLHEKLNECISDIGEIRKKKMCSIAEKYDWSTMVTVYDALFSSFI
jgi:hypothetical protein